MNRLASRPALALLALAAILGLTLPAPAGDLVPFRGSAEGMITGATPTPNGLLLTATATGQATHLGRFTRGERVLVRADGTLTGTLVFTAANGDRLFASAAGGFISPTTTVGTYTFTGGTGRFRNATGVVRFVAVTPDGRRFAVTFEGTIRF